MPKTFLCITLVALTLAGCDALSSDEAVSFSKAEQTEALRVQVTGTTVLRDRSEWTSFWERHGGSGPAPAVDFDQQLVVGVFYGGSPRAGCQSAVNVVGSVLRDGNTVRVQIKPLPDLGSCRAVVYPLDVVVVDVPASEALAVRFEGRVP